MSVLAARGFVAAGGACGIKASGAPDLALVATADHRPVPAAGVFTTNLAQAAPVQISRRHLADGTAAAVVLNSGNANAATGATGRANATRMAELAAAGLGCAPGDVLVCSTGLIGIPMPMAPVESGVPHLVTQLGPDAAHASAAADAILTTDTVRKEAVACFAHGANGATVGGMAKGAAMLSPAMATMLAVVTTDAPVTAAVLQRTLAEAVGQSFDNLLVDGSRSTNDTVLVLAGGQAGGAVIDGSDAGAMHRFADALGSVCASLAEQMARDAEGATKFARITVRGAASQAQARQAARAVAASQLVQCSLYGADPYWGRILSELGASGVHLDPERVDIAYGGITVCRDGVAYAHDEGTVAGHMAGRDIEIVCDLHVAHGECTVLSTDLTPAYIDENMRTS